MIRETSREMQCLTQNLRYMYNQVHINQTESLQFPKPEFCLGQQVRNRSNLVGYITGLMFYPDEGNWCYCLYSPNQRNGGIHEIWYGAEELDVSLDLHDRGAQSDVL